MKCRALNEIAMIGIVVFSSFQVVAQDIEIDIEKLRGASGRVMKGKCREIVPVPGCSPMDVALSPDNKTLAIACEEWKNKIGGGAFLWDWQARKLSRRLKKTEGPVLAVRFSPDGKMLAAAAREGTLLWDLSQKKPARNLQPYITASIGVVFSKDGKRLASGSQTGDLVVWDASSGKRVVQLQKSSPSLGIQVDLDLSPDGGLLVVAVEKAAQLWDVSTGKMIRAFQHESNVNSVVFAENSKRLITAGLDEKLYWWDTSTGKLLRSVPGHAGFIRNLTVSADGRWVAGPTSDSSSVGLWEVATGKPAGEIPREFTRCVAFSRREKYLVGADTSEVFLWDLE